jgi:hypothetical protein
MARNVLDAHACFTHTTQWARPEAELTMEITTSVRRRLTPSDSSSKCGVRVPTIQRCRCYAHFAMKKTRARERYSPSVVRLVVPPGEVVATSAANHALNCIEIADTPKLKFHDPARL